MDAHTASIPVRGDQSEVMALASARSCSLQARADVRQGHMDLLREHAFSVMQRYQLELAPPPPELPPPEEELLELLDDEDDDEEDEDEEDDEDEDDFRLA